MAMSYFYWCYHGQRHRLSLVKSFAVHGLFLVQVASHPWEERHYLCIFYVSSDKVYAEISLALCYTTDTSQVSYLHSWFVFLQLEQGSLIERSHFI